MALDKVDVLIVGAGASAAAVAWGLVETRMRIVCLEQGGWPVPERFPSTERDWEIRQYTDFNTNPNDRRAPEDYPINDGDSPIKIVNFNGVGGGTVLYGGHFPRFHPSDFRVCTQDNVADDWPIDYDTLAPFYAENERMMGISGLAGDPAYPPKEAIMPPLPLGRSGETLARGFNKLGWHWWPTDSTIATQEYEGRAPCINLGLCTSGCAQGAKGSTDITYWPAAIRAGVELRTHCRVSRILCDDDGFATGAAYFDADGNEQFQPAEVVIMASNGVGTPRILLNSVSRRFPNGLANSSGLVGKNLMFHPCAYVVGTFEEEQDGFRGPHNWLASQEFYETDLSRGFVRGYTMEANRGSGPVMTALRGMMSGRIPFGEGHHEAMRRFFNHYTSLIVMAEDLPEEHNCVTLDPELTDSNGIPAPKIHYRLSENSWRILRHGTERATEALRAAGAIDVQSQLPIAGGGWHLMGTARMGTDPARSVVNEWGRSHDVKNLFIVDGSIFVTSAGVNPTSTIQALALYIADQMKQRLATLFD
ncbi:GMC family oxidoreductase [Novosphingobium malaysiense]|uniref:Choline dehydrogenase n=1 Tax=Novosphingobium malaysiense TaxID=1348853 RepID=A0A0B1ZM18_9SPHN|nr:GMC family oxidoreductase [Novosphingobium malaysiense]KHK90384.1 choline dehydrogenase [Novosphingobium malaysiense]